MRKLPLLLVFVLLFVGCAAPATPAVPAPTAAATAAAPAAPPGGVFQVIKPDGSAVTVSLDDLKKLPLITIMSDGQPEEGPSLLAVLSSVNVTDFKTVSLTGADGTRDLQRADVTPDVILDFNNRGSVKLVSPTMSKDVRVRDITKIVVK